MLKWLLQWVKKLWKYPYGRKQTAGSKAMAGYQVVQQLPELTNADLEFLFTQLLEGVYQARGQYWAIKYLQRMEHRISTERWIEWLLNFGEKLLTSPAPNNHIAERMVQLGELRIGMIGDLAYDIGTRLLTRNLGGQYWQTHVEELEIPAPAPTPVSLPQLELTSNLPNQDEENTVPKLVPETPGIDLIRNLGELLWEYQEDNVASITQSNFVPSLDIVKEDTAWQDFEEETWVRESLAVTAVDESWKNSPPIVDTSLDDLLVRLEQSTNLVQQLAVGLGIQTNDTHAIIEALSDEANGNSVQAEGWFYEGLQQAKIGDLQGALKYYNKSLELNPNAYEYWFNRGLTLFYLGNFTEAIASYDQAIQIKADFYKGWYNRGAALSELGNFTEAIASFDQALKLKSDYQEAWSARGLVQLKLGNLSEAIASFDASLQIQPQDPESWYLRGTALAEAGQNYDAIACYNHALEYYPEFDLAWYKLGVALFNAGNWEDAIANYHQAIKINPECYQAWYGLGGVKEKLGKIEEAIAAYDRCTQIQPNFHEAWIDRGVILAGLGKWEEAIASWDKAIAIDPDFYLTWFNRGVALDNLGRRQEAISSYDKAIEIQSDFYLAWYNRGLAQFYLGQFEEAIVSYDSALQIQPDYWEAWLGRGSAAGNAIMLEWQSKVYSSIAADNHALNERGYEGKLASYQEGLRYVNPNTHPEGWGRLCLAIGNAHYDRGKRHPLPRHYWLEAAAAYENALITLTEEVFPVLHLETLQNLIKTLVVLGETKQAHQYQQHGIYLLQSLLNEPTRTDVDKKQLALRFAGLGQLAVDIAIQFGELAQGWEIAEYGKNACFTWLFSDLSTQITSPSYTEIHQLLNPNTAIIYWHISPCTLRTFVIKYKSPEPIPIFTPVLNIASINDLPVPEAVARLSAFEDWMEQWYQQYKESFSLSDEEQNRNKYSWDLDIERKLLQLKKILNISAIVQELEDVNQLILIPHRDLHKLPLHSLFYLDYFGEEKSQNLSSNFTITYLSSAQMGLSLKAKPIEKTDEKRMLCVESATGYSKQKFTKVETEVISQIFAHFQCIPEARATKEYVKNCLLKDYNIFHFMGQIIENYGQPYASELVLANQWKITLAELDINQLASYKLLSFCNIETSSVGFQTITTEYTGLPTGLLNLGIPHILTNFWNVESPVNTLVIIEFYQRIKQNKSPAIALAETILWLKELTACELTRWYEQLLEQIPSEGLRIKTHLASELYRTSQMAPDTKIYHHPYYWAGFKITGKLE
ncbi:tetratricopeptide repeat protein [Mastigocladus laminosus UU774]|nr:tetratricopeptide repeat protein [Mastigocladus laminosus UU774]